MYMLMRRLALMESDWMFSDVLILSMYNISLIRQLHVHKLPSSLFDSNVIYH